MAEVVAPVDHTQDAAPVADKVVLVPLQIFTSFPANTVGNGLTVTSVAVVSEQPFASVTLTIYVVLLFGVTVIAALVCPFGH